MSTISFVQNIPNLILYSLHQTPYLPAYSQTCRALENNLAELVKISKDGLLITCNVTRWHDFIRLIWAKSARCRRTWPTDVHDATLCTLSSLSIDHIIQFNDRTIIYSTLQMFRDGSKASSWDHKLLKKIILAPPDEKYLATSSHHWSRGQNS